MINKIYVLESIPSDEIQTGEELYNDTIYRYKKFYNSDIEIFFEKFESKNDLQKILKQIETQSVESDAILLHIETHGNKSVLGLKNNDEIDWNEFSDLLIPINSKIKNKLFLNIVACFGRYVAFTMELKKTSPYKCFISSSDVLLPREILNDNTILYDNLLRTGNIYEAYINLFEINPKTKFYIKEVETILSFHIIPNLDLFLKNGSLFLLKSFFDSYLNLNINLSEIEKVEDKSKHIFDKFIERFTYKN
ncbi:C13 family peptidase [Epilithonimonas mollis]|uniref:Peptidase C13 family protein n=1 Tax=Epilithonimonas mollis TaxID=216903 RepID=A0A1M6PQM4_9FLAO|nr:C13 family peptidase [Epilithonimonas mollis]SHK10279.1 Peptidase C13 family protein [Epilithonimonas mollis]